MLVFCSATKAPLERGSDGGKSSQFVLLGLREVGSILLMACGYIGLYRLYPMAMGDRL